MGLVGISRVIVPAPFVTVISFVVPVSVASVGSVVPSPMRSCPLASTAVAVTAPVPEPKSTPPSVRVAAPVPPEETASTVPRESVPDISIVPEFISIVPVVVRSISPVPALSCIWLF